MRRIDIIQGLRIGIPIALGYFAVAFSLGIIAKQAGLTAAIGFVSRFFTRASAGEYGVYTLVAAQAAYVEIVAMCLVVNLRYMLMSAALSQKIAPGTSWVHRVLMACCVTDEIFGISISRLGYCPPAYTYSLQGLRHDAPIFGDAFFCIATAGDATVVDADEAKTLDGLTRIGERIGVEDRALTPSEVLVNLTKSLYCHRSLLS